MARAVYGVPADNSYYQKSVVKSQATILALNPPTSAIIFPQLKQNVAFQNPIA